MKPRPFDYVRPETVEEAVALLAEHGDDARVLAGGQSLMPMLNLRLVEPTFSIDIARIARTRRHPRPRRHDRGRRRGDAESVCSPGRSLPQSCRCSRPRCRSSAISRPATAARSAARLPMPIRVRNCRCRSRCSKARWCCSRRPATRTIKADEFQVEMLTTAREPEELVTAVRFPVTHGNGVAFREVARRHGDFAIIAVAAVVENGKSRAPRRRRHERQAGRAAASRWTVTPRFETRSTRSPRNWRATRTCTPLRECGAICCAGSAPSSSRRPADAPR